MKYLITAVLLLGCAKKPVPEAHHQKHFLRLIVVSKNGDTTSSPVHYK